MWAIIIVQKAMWSTALGCLLLNLPGNVQTAHVERKSTGGRLRSLTQLHCPPALLGLLILLLDWICLSCALSCCQQGSYAVCIVMHDINLL